MCMVIPIPIENSIGIFLYFKDTCYLIDFAFRVGGIPTDSLQFFDNDFLLDVEENPLNERSLHFIKCSYVELIYFFVCHNTSLLSSLRERSLFRFNHQRLFMTAGSLLIRSPLSSVAILSISDSLSSKSNTSIFSSIREGVTDLGITIDPD